MSLSGTLIQPLETTQASLKKLKYMSQISYDDELVTYH